jgi:hypothetical protein
MASSDDVYSVYLTIAGFCGLCCFVCDYHRRQHMLDVAEVQQQVHVNGGRPGFPGALAQTAAADREKRKQDVMNALILRTVAVSDITMPSVGDAKGDDVEQSGLPSPTIDFSIRSAQRELVESSSRSLREVYLDLSADEEVNQAEITPVSPLEQCDVCIDEGEGAMRRSAAACNCNPNQVHVHTSNTRSSTKRGPISGMPLVDDTNLEDQAPDPLETTTAMGLLLAEEGDIKKGGEGRLAEATCSICLLGYEEGDGIAWSRNPGCNHAFHEECIVPWLMHKKEECPNCRSNYFVFEDEQNKYNTDTDTESKSDTESIVSDTSYEDTYRNQRHGNPASEYGGASAAEQV